MTDIYSQLTGGLAHQGSWGPTPDFGLSEILAKALGRPTSSQGGSNILPNPIRPLAQETPTNTSTTYTAPKTGTPTQTFGDLLKQDGSVRSDGNGGGGGDNGGGNKPPYSSNVANQTVDYGGQTWKSDGKGGWYAEAKDNAQAAYQANLDAIQGRLNEARRLAGEKVGQATKDRDYIMELISKRYPELQGRVEQQRTSTLGELDSNATTLQDVYDRAKAQARRRSESAALKNRMVARAGNRLGSSFYDDIVASNSENLGSELAQTDREKLDKLATIDTQKVEANQTYDNEIKDLDFQKTQAEDQAVKDYEQAVSTAQALDRAGVLDFGEAEAQARDNLNSKLSQIDQWAQNIVLQKQALDAQYGKTNNTLSTYTPFTADRVAKFNDNTNVNSLSSYSPEIMGNPTASVSQSPVNLLQAMSANRGGSSLDELLKRLNPSLMVS